MAFFDNLDTYAVGDTISQYPLQQLILSLAEGIADAQLALDEASILASVALRERTLTINGQTRSLLELGFLPTFYHFQSAKIKVSVSITMKIEESTSESFGGSVTVSGEYETGSTTFNSPPSSSPP